MTQISHGTTQKMENMAALWINDLSPMEVFDLDAFDRNQLSFRQTSTQHSLRRDGHVSARWQVLRVLIVDNEQDTVDDLVSLVRRYGSAAHVASNGVATLRVAASQQFDVVLLDMELPLKDACQVARQLRLDHVRSDCLIIAVAVQADEQRRQQCRQAGIDLVLTRPVDLETLETLLMMECVLRNRRRAIRTGNNRRNLHETGDSSC